MKKKLFLIVLLFSLMMIPVKALEHIPGELIPRDEEATITTDVFAYQGVSYRDDGENGTFNFKGVLNKSSKQMYMSVNILLFDASRINIGFVSYCTERDVESNYSQVKVNSNQTKPLSIKVSKKYFTDDKKSSDVAYYSVLDANEYCQIGGYEKYEGLTIEEILNGKVATVEEEKPATEIISKVTKYIPIVIVVIVLVVVVSIVMKLIKKKSSEKMVINNVVSPEEKSEPERIRKPVEKEEELTEEVREDSNLEQAGNTYVNLSFDNQETESLENDSILLEESLNNQETLVEEKKEEETNLEEKETFAPPQETTPPVVNNNNDSNELMDLFK